MLWLEHISPEQLQMGAAVCNAHRDASDCHIT